MTVTVTRLLVGRLGEGGHARARPMATRQDPLGALANSKRGQGRKEQN